MTYEERDAVILEDRILDAILKPRFNSYRVLEKVAEALTDRVLYYDDLPPEEDAILRAFTTYLDTMIAERKAKYEELYGKPA